MILSDNNEARVRGLVATDATDATMSRAEAQAIAAEAIDYTEARLRSLLATEQAAFTALPRLQRKFPPAEYMELVRETVDAFAPKYMPQVSRCFEAVIAGVRTWRAELDKFDAAVAATDPEDPSEVPSPHQELWWRRSEAHAVAARGRPPLHPIPLPARLHADGVPWRQIGTMWRLTVDPCDPRAEPLSELVVRAVTDSSIVDEAWAAFVLARREFEGGQSLIEPLPPKMLPDLSDVAAGRSVRPTIRDMLYQSVPQRLLSDSVLPAEYPGTTTAEWDSILPDLAVMLRVRLFGSASELAAEAAEVEYAKEHDGRRMPDSRPWPPSNWASAHSIGSSPAPSPVPVHQAGRPRTSLEIILGQKQQQEPAAPETNERELMRRAYAGRERGLRDDEIALELGISDQPGRRGTAVEYVGALIMGHISGASNVEIPVGPFGAYGAWQQR